MGPDRAGKALNRWPSSDKGRHEMQSRSISVVPRLLRLADDEDRDAHSNEFYIDRFAANAIELRPDLCVMNDGAGDQERQRKQSTRWAICVKEKKEMPTGITIVRATKSIPRAVARFDVTRLK
jgi:hypothetical protein